jgi:hypothetical protein
MVVERLDRALRLAGIPIVGVSGNEADRSSWRIDYHPSATAQQRTDGETLRGTFDPFSQAAIDAEKAERAASSDTDLLIQAVARVDFEERQKLTVKAGQTLLTAAETKARIRAIYQSLL